jgi:hypothetical protein
MSVIDAAIRANWYSRRAEWVNARNIGYLEHELNDLIDGLTKLRDVPKTVVADHIPQVRKARTARKAATVIVS